MLRGIRIWFTTVATTVILGVIAYMVFLIRDQLHSTGLIFVGLLDELLLCLEWVLAIGTMCGCLFMIVLLLKLTFKPHYTQLGPFGVLERFGPMTRVYGPQNSLLPQQQRQVVDAQATKTPNERPVHIIPARVYPSRAEPEPLDDIAGSDGEQAGSQEGYTQFNGNEYSYTEPELTDDLLGIAHAAYVGGARGRRTLSDAIGVSTHTAASLIKQLKQRGLVADEKKEIRPE